MNGWLEGFAQAGNRYPLFGIMLYDACRPPALICGKIPSRIFAWKIRAFRPCRRGGRPTLTRDSWPHRGKPIAPDG